MHEIAWTIICHERACNRTVSFLCLQSRNKVQNSFQRLAKWWNNQVLLEHFEAFGQKFSKCENARMREERILCDRRLWLGFRMTEKTLYICCLTKLNQVLTKLCSFNQFANFALLAKRVVCGSKLHEFWALASLKWQLKQFPNGQLCWKWINQKVNHWSNLNFNETSQKMPFWLARFWYMMFIFLERGD